MPVIKSRTRRVNAIAGGSLEAAAELGVLFGCHRGVCGKCATTVLSGLNHLSAPTEEEVAMGLDPAVQVYPFLERDDAAEAKTMRTLIASAAERGGTTAASATPVGGHAAAAVADGPLCLICS